MADEHPHTFAQVIGITKHKKFSDIFIDDGCRNFFLSRKYDIKIGDKVLLDYSYPAPDDYRYMMAWFRNNVCIGTILIHRKNVFA